MVDESNLSCISNWYKFEAANLNLNERLNSVNFDIDKFKKEIQEQWFQSIKHLIEAIKLNKLNDLSVCWNMNQDKLQDFIDKLEIILKKYPELDESANNPVTPKIPIVWKYYNA